MLICKPSANVGIKFLKKILTNVLSIERDFVVLWGVGG
jgi:hypothetical protein